jgi:hypothetical protein
MNIDDRLRALASDLPGDWSDVRTRAERLGRSRARQRRRVVLAFATVGLVVAASAIGARALDFFAVTETPREVPLRSADVAWVAGTTLHVPGGRPQELSFPVLAPLIGTEPPLAVRSPDRRELVYHAWQDNTPLLVLRDVVNGRERVLVRGAQTFAWSADGRRAWFQGDHARQRDDPGGDPYLGHVVVDGERWTTEHGPYQVLAWAGERLLVAIERCLICRETREPGVYVIDGPGPLVRLPLDSVSALSPDGRLAIGIHLPVPTQDSPSSLVRLVDVQRGRVLQTLDLARAVRTTHTPFIERGAWRGNEIVAPVQSDTLVSMRVDNRRLRVVGQVRVPRSTIPVLFGVNIGVPSFVGNGTRRVVFVVTGDRANGYSAAVLTCERAARRCVRGRMLPPRRWFAVVENPSRPMP